MLKRIIKFLLPIFDFVLVPLVYPSALLLKNIRLVGVHHLPRCKKALLNVGVFPIRAHYYEPLFDERFITRPLTDDRNLPGIDWNTREQLALLESFSYNNELSGIPSSKSSKQEFFLNNGSFESGDAEYWYNMIRFKKPRKIIEIGSGNSTLMAIRAIKKNEEDLDHKCKHICIEPFENEWLERTGVHVIRKKVEEVDKSIFFDLGMNDIVFIDSSHVIRSQGDVLCEYLEVLPLLSKGVIVHIHDIFSPKDYPEAWVRKEVRFWNEQYLLEAFLTNNSDWKIIGALNYLHHNYYNELKSKCPYVAREREPGSFYIQKIA